MERIYLTKEGTLSEQQQRLRSWRTLLESSKQHAESTIQSSGSAESLISILNAKSELTNVISKEPLLELQTDSKLSVFFEGGYLMDMLKKAGEVSGDNGNSRPVSLARPSFILNKPPARKKR